MTEQTLYQTLKPFLKELDPNLRAFCSEIRKELRNEKDSVIAITGYPGLGKSQTAALIGLLIDHLYEFDKNICFIPTSKQIERQYLGLPMYSILHIDEASRGLHKHAWQDKTQQKLNQLYDTDREGHFLCTLLLMPRFQNFTENFRNFRVKYWINIVDRGLAIVYKRDEDKDAKDPWHIDENYKLKQKAWRGKMIYERDTPSVVRMEQKTKNYWFYFRLPPIPEEVWAGYQGLKAQSRIDAKDAEMEVETYKDRMNREKIERFTKISQMCKKGMTAPEQAIELGVSEVTVRRAWREMRSYDKIKGTNYMPEEVKVEASKQEVEIPKEFDQL